MSTPLCTRLEGMTSQWSNWSASLVLACVNNPSLIQERRNNTQAARQHCTHVDRSQPQQPKMKVSIHFNGIAMKEVTWISYVYEWAPVSHSGAAAFNLAPCICRRARDKELMCTGKPVCPPHRSINCFYSRLLLHKLVVPQEVINTGTWLRFDFLVILST